MNDHGDTGPDTSNALIKAMPVLYSFAKTLTDYFLSVLLLLILSPFLLILATVIRLSGKGPVIFSQDRIGKDGKPFSIYKFRSMVFDAEKVEPYLSGSGDERVTLIGRFLRKYRVVATNVTVFMNRGT